MAQLLLINPKVKPSQRKSKGVKKVAKKRRSAAQKAATRKLVALNKSKKRGKTVVKAKHKKRRRNPIANVTKRRKHRAVTSHRIARRHKRRSNPIAAKFGLGGMAKMAMSSAVAAGGALSLDLAWGFLPLPDAVKLGPMRHVAKGAGAIALGILAGFVVKKETANALATGAMTVVMYNAARELLANVAPQIALGEYMSVQAPQMGEFMSEIEHQGVDGLMDGENVYDMQGISDGSDDF